MLKLFLASICVLAPSFAAGFAAEPRPVAQTGVASTRASVDATRDKPDQVVEHLLKAAQHLEAAGFVEESAKIRDDARQRALRDNVLSRKESELECLQEEVDRLRVLTGQVHVVLVEIIAIEVDRARLGLKTRDFDRMVGFSAAESPVVSAMLNGQTGFLKKSSADAGIVEANPERLPLFRELREKGAIKILAQPTVRTATNCPASVLAGGEVPIRIKSSTGDVTIRTVPFGTRVEVRAVVLPNQRIRLLTTVEMTNVSPSEIVDDDGTPFPGTSSRRFSTEVEMHLGQTLAAGRLVCDRPFDAAARDDKPSPHGTNTGTARPVAHAYAPSDSVETVVFITPRLVQGTDTPQALPAEPAASELDGNAANVLEDLTPTDWDAFGPVVPVLKRRTTGRN